MKQLATSLLGALLGIGLALFVYDRFIVQPREAKRAEAATLDLSQAGEEAKKITQSVDASIKQSVDSARQAFEAQAADEHKRRMAAEAIAQTQSCKAALTESFMSNGKWPAEASDAGLPQSNANAGGAIRDLSVDERGAISLAFDGNFAEGAQLRLVPRPTPTPIRCAGDAGLPAIRT